MLKVGWPLWNFFEKRPRPREAENESVGAIVRLLKARQATTDKEKDEELSPSPSDDFAARGRR